jgi:hypothetical protein
VRTARRHGLGEDAIDVRPDRVAAQEQLTGDLAVRAALVDPGQLDRGPPRIRHANDSQYGGHDNQLLAMHWAAVNCRAIAYPVIATTATTFQHIHGAGARNPVVGKRQPVR